MVQRRGVLFALVVLLALVVGAGEGLAIPPPTDGALQGGSVQTIKYEGQDPGIIAGGQSLPPRGSEGGEEGASATLPSLTIYPPEGMTGVVYNTDISFTLWHYCTGHDPDPSEIPMLMNQELTDLSTGLTVPYSSLGVIYGDCSSLGDYETYYVRYRLRPNTPYRHQISAYMMPYFGYNYTNTTTFTTGPYPWTRPRIVFRGGEWILDSNYDGTVDDRDRFGMPGDIPFIGWWDDSHLYRGVFRNGEWILDTNFDGVVDSRSSFGMKGDIPLVYYDSDHKVRVRAVFRPSAWENWIIDRGMDGTVESRSHFGSPGDRPVIGFYGGATDMPYRAVFRSGTWIWDDNMDGTVERRGTFGTSGDIPLAGSFDNYPAIDIGVFRGGTWIVDYTSPAYQADYRDRYGQAGDIPLYWVQPD